jgi:signal transduction histidine kinase
VQLLARDVTARFEMTQALEQAVHDQLEAADQLRRLNVMKDTFLQSVSHELRTPLTSVIGFAQLLTDPRHGLSPQQTRDFHLRILTSAKRLHSACWTTCWTSTGSPEETSRLSAYPPT